MELYMNNHFLIKNHGWFLFDYGRYYSRNMQPEHGFTTMIVISARDGLERHYDMEDVVVAPKWMYLSETVN